MVIYFFGKLCNTDGILNLSEAIMTNDYNRSQRFLAEVDSSVVLINASTRFNDGNQLGLGAEIGVNTSKLHAFGPMGLEELTTIKLFMDMGRRGARSIVFCDRIIHSGLNQDRSHVTSLFPPPWP